MHKRRGGGAFNFNFNSIRAENITSHGLRTAHTLAKMETTTKLTPQHLIALVRRPMQHIRCSSHIVCGPLTNFVVYGRRLAFNRKGNTTSCVDVLSNVGIDLNVTSVHRGCSGLGVPVRALCRLKKDFTQCQCAPHIYFSFNRWNQLNPRFFLLFSGSSLFHLTVVSFRSFPIACHCIIYIVVPQVNWYLHQQRQQKIKLPTTKCQLINWISLNFLCRVH